MKRLFCLLLTLLTILSLTGCGNDTSAGIIGGADGLTEIYISDGENSYTLEEFTQEQLPDLLTGQGWKDSDETQETGETEDDFDWDRFNEKHGEDAALAPADPNADTYITETGSEEEVLPEDGVYTTKEDVAYFIYLYGRLPDNFITKDEARELGWEGGSLDPYAPGMCIGGDRFGNREGLLPEAPDRRYTECDIDTLGAKKRGSKRIVFSNDGLIFYTDDHYESFELLYGDIEYDPSDD